MQYQTQLFWTRLHQYAVFVSTEGKREISRTQDATRRQQLLALVAPFQEMDSNIPEIQTLAQEYVDRGIFSVRFLPDAIHVATTTVYHLNFLVSWNFQHLADAKRILQVNAINLSLGYG